jgi:formylglycine-generating enzyme required for sulfatase activity
MGKTIECAISGAKGGDRYKVKEEEKKLVRQRVLIGLNFIYISGGELNLDYGGNSGPKAIRPFWIRKSCISRTEFAGYAAYNGGLKKSDSVQESAGNLSYYAASEFVRRISRSCQMRFRFPTEDEWIFSALLYGRNNGRGREFYLDPAVWEIANTWQSNGLKKEKLYFVAKQAANQNGRLTESVRRQMLYDANTKVKNLSFRLVYQEENLK